MNMPRLVIDVNVILASFGGGRNSLSSQVHTQFRRSKRLVLESEGVTGALSGQVEQLRRTALQETFHLNVIKPLYPHRENYHQTQTL
jgi:hypothetical protein